MRVAMCIVAVLVVTTPSEASKSCMTKAEARQQFGSVHIYWHGPAHCWDATRHDAKSSKRSSKKLPPVKTLPLVKLNNRLTSPSGVIPGRKCWLTTALCSRSG
jgi:hypothetical protein